MKARPVRRIVPDGNGKWTWIMPVKDIWSLTESTNTEKESLRQPTIRREGAVYVDVPTNKSLGDDLLSGLSDTETDLVDFSRGAQYAVEDASADGRSIASKDHRAIMFFATGEYENHPIVARSNQLLADLAEAGVACSSASSDPYTESIGWGHILMDRGSKRIQVLLPAGERCSKLATGGRLIAELEEAKFITRHISVTNVELCTALQKVILQFVNCSYAEIRVAALSALVAHGMRRISAPGAPVSTMSVIVEIMDCVELSLRKLFQDEQSRLFGGDDE